jgi:AraC-like DNA-binding protein
MIVFFIAALPMSFIPWSAKVDLATEALRNVGFIHTYKATFLDNIFSVLAIYLSRPILVLVYTIYSIGLLISYSMQRNVSQVFARQYFMTKWLYLLLGFLLMLEVTQVLLIIKAFKMDFSELFFTFDFLRILSVTGLAGLLISPFFFPSILYGLPRFPETVLTTNSPQVELDQIAEDHPKKANHFETEYLLLIHHKADSCMKEIQPYLHPDFNLVKLSVQTQIPIHHLSYYFREEKKQHFNDYMNMWRINHAKNLIREGKTNGLTLEGIGLISGFPNRNSFCSTFKKVEGISPSAFMAQIKK